MSAAVEPPDGALDDPTLQQHDEAFGLLGLILGLIEALDDLDLVALRARGLTVTALFGVYGAERDAAVVRARVIVNIHYYAAAIFEAVRIAPLLAAGRCVVSEGNPEDPDVADLAEGLVLCPYDDLVETCTGLCRDAPRRQDLADRARAVARTRTQAEVLRALFPEEERAG